MIDAGSLLGLSVIVGASVSFLDLVLFNLVQKAHRRGLTGIGPIKHETWEICFELLHSPSWIRPNKRPSNLFERKHISLFAILSPTLWINERWQ